MIQSGQRRFATKLKQYTKPLQANTYTISPTRKVPPHLPAPYYYGMKQQPMPDLFNPNIYVMNLEEQQNLREAANIAGQTLKHAVENTKEGMSLDDVDQIVHEFIISKNAFPSCINFMNFPKSVCTSVNEVVSHGVPNSKILENGDYLNIDVTCFYKGHFGDTSAMVMIGDVHPDIRHLSQTTREAMYKGIEICGPGVPFRKIGVEIQKHADENGYYANREFGGHGISHKLHMPPLIYHYDTDEYTKEVMKPGMAFTIEPILMMSDKFQYIQWKDKWTISAPGVPSCQWEHIILITETGYEILTLREGETSPFAK